MDRSEEIAWFERRKALTAEALREHAQYQSEQKDFNSGYNALYKGIDDAKRACPDFLGHLDTAQVVALVLSTWPPITGRY